MKIAFGYKISSGKDTCVDYLIEKYGGHKISFAQYLYDILYYAQKVCGFEVEKDRKFLQWVGTEWARMKDPDVWVRLTVQESERIEKEEINKNIYCSDVRFVNEFEALKKNGWILIKINRPEIKSDIRIGTGSISHISENMLDTVEDKEWDYIIDNNSSKEKLFQDLENIIRDISKNFEK
jgi:hypothetical protein